MELRVDEINENVDDTNSTELITTISCFEDYSCKEMVLPQTTLKTYILC